jgi:SAM-dependent methyltransferase
MPESTYKSFWNDYYSNFKGKDVPWLDYSNERVQSQTFALALEAAGPISGRRCLDVGCGNGQICLCLKALQAAEVTGIDFMAEFVEKNRKKNPAIRWVCGDLTDPNVYGILEEYDRIFMLEVLQCLSSHEEVITKLWGKIPSNGRFIAAVPNRDCPIVVKTTERMPGTYTPSSFSELRSIFTKLPALEWWAIRGLSFQADQQLLPYFPSPWTTEPRWAIIPNRLLFVLQKK